MRDFPVRRRLSHVPPASVSPFVVGAPFFLTICVDRRRCGIGGSDVGRVGPLLSPAIADAILGAVDFRRESGDWNPRIALVMPDHVHLIVSFPADRSMRVVVSGFKRFLAARRGIPWQSGFFDHRLRTDEETAEKTAYIEMNPVRKGLCRDPLDWPFRRVWGAW